MGLYDRKAAFIEAILCREYADDPALLRSALKKVAADPELAERLIASRLASSEFDRTLALSFGLTVADMQPNKQPLTDRARGRIFYVAM